MILLGYMDAMTTLEKQPILPFFKMHGLGNDFVVIDGRHAVRGMTATLAAAIGHRHLGVGFDQLALIEESEHADARLIFYNADGSTAGACGNATRCVARHMFKESGQDALVLETERGLLACEDAGNGLTRVNMGMPMFDWQDIPLAREMDTLELPIDGAPSAMGMGNPHMTFLVDDADAVDLAGIGEVMEHHPLYPERTNVEFISPLGPDSIRMRIWERGVGVTMASGSGSCAAAVTAARRGLTGRKVSVHLEVGIIEIDWREDGVWMTGPTAHVFDGVFTADFLAGLSE
jgi:diaminopimelate epimerase